MNLGALLTPHLARMRAAAETLMVDTVTIDRWDGTTSIDENTLAETKNYAAPLYGPTVNTDSGRNGRARIQQHAAVSDEEAGPGRTVTTLRLELQLPITVTGLQVDDRVVVDAAVHDPDLVGREFRISDLHHKTHATSRRVAIEEITS